MASFITPWALGWIAGTAWQLQQAQLWAWWLYAGLGMCLVCLGAWGVHLGHRVSTRVRWALWCGVAMGLAGAQTGLRACWYAAHALNPAYEGQTLTVDGVVSQMPQRTDDSLRFRFQVSAAWDATGKAVGLPPQLLLGWYGPRVLETADYLPDRVGPADVHAGDRWRLQVRLKAPHGHINPHGFDYELWLWEQGVQATGYVRTSAKDMSPQRVSTGWGHPVERVRQATREAIDAQLGDRASAGIVSALLVGDQAAIERADWDVFRATGMAHLMAISGLHITGLAWWRHCAWASSGGAATG
jgi:competence protein ComEC